MQTYSVFETFTVMWKSEVNEIVAGVQAWVQLVCVTLLC